MGIHVYCFDHFGNIQSVTEENTCTVFMFLVLRKRKSFIPHNNLCNIFIYLKKNRYFSPSNTFCQVKLWKVTRRSYVCTSTRLRQSGSPEVPPAVSAVKCSETRRR